MKIRTMGIWAGVIGLAWGGPIQAAEENPVVSTGYTVNVELLIGETGAVEETKVVSSEDEILNGLALNIAGKMRQPVRQKDGVAVKYHVVAPLTFPVEGDGGPEAQKAPQPKPRVQPMPAFPREEASAGTAGGALLELSINEKGKVTDVRMVRASQPSFGRAAVQAARLWVFMPLVIDGKPTPTKLYQAMTFEPSGNKADWKWYVAPRPCLPRYEVSGYYIPAN